jgi:hypothetical protein
MLRDTGYKVISQMQGYYFATESLVGWRNN